MENVRILPDGEAVSVDGTHLGHNLPDYKGNRHLVEFESWMFSYLFEIVSTRKNDTKRLKLVQFL